MLLIHCILNELMAEQISEVVKPWFDSGVSALKVILFLQCILHFIK